MNEDLRDLLKDDLKRQKCLELGSEWTTQAPKSSPEGITAKWTECLLFFFFKHWSFHFSFQQSCEIGPSFLLIYQFYQYTENLIYTKSHG